MKATILILVVMATNDQNTVKSKRLQLISMMY